MVAKSLFRCIIILFYVNVSFVSGIFEAKRCSLSVLEVVCPRNSHCLERENSSQGECKCKSGYVFNALYTNNQDYCLPDTSTIRPAAISVAEPSIATNNTTNVPHHHIIGGILIPIVLVVVFIGVVFFMVRYRVLQRIRDNVSRRRRHNRPTYHMGTEFDPPLI